MLSIHGPTRRELLRAGSLSLLGLGAFDLALLRARSTATPVTARRRRNACVFLFLFAFDFQSFLERKNPEAAVHAFRKAFGDREDVLLVLKSVHAADAPPAGNRASKTTTDSPAAASASAQAAPTIPPPTMATSGAARTPAVKAPLLRR